MDRRIIAATQLVLIFPAALFLTAVVARHLQPLQFAQEIVTWYSVRYWTLWILLIGLPVTALLNGCIVLLHNSNDETDEGQITKQLFTAIRTELLTSDANHSCGDTHSRVDFGCCCPAHAGKLNG
jgi:heme/copper-type cytochrome/quinol oxidase subunit 2